MSRSECYDFHFQHSGNESTKIPVPTFSTIIHHTILNVCECVYKVKYYNNRRHSTYQFIKTELQTSLKIKDFYFVWTKLIDRKKIQQNDLYYCGKKQLGYRKVS